MQPAPEHNDPRHAHGASASFAPRELVERCLGNASVALLVLDKFEKQLQSDIAQIERDLAVGSAPAIGRTAHALKGAAGAVGAGALMDLAARVEACAQQDRLDAIARDLESLRAEVDRCLEGFPRARTELGRAVAPDEPGRGGIA